MNFTWLQENALVLLFYLAIALIIYFNRKKFEFQGIVALFKTKLGIKQMKKFATPLSKKKDMVGRAIFNVSTFILLASTTLLIINTFFEILNRAGFLINGLIIVASFLALCVSILFFRQIKPAGKLGIYIGFIGMIFVVGLIGVGVYQIIFVPEAPPMFSPVFPGISIPGSPLKLPLFEGLIALLVVIVVHEFSHGVVSKAYKIPIKSSGFVMFGPIPGAFVEPNEKKLKKASNKAQLSIYAAGPFSNILLAVLIFLATFFITALSVSLYEPSGVIIDGFIDDTDLESRGLNNLKEGEIILKINNDAIRNSFDLVNITISKYGPGDEVLFVTNKGENIIKLGADPRNESIPLIGIYLDNAVQGTNKLSENKIFTTAYFWLFGNPHSMNLNRNLGLIPLIFVLSFGIGIVNLLPAGPLDGGRMFYVVFKNKIGEKRTLKILSIISLLFLFIILALIFIPIISAII